MKTFKQLKDLYELADTETQKSTGFLIGITIITAILETTGIASIFPLMAMLSDIEKFLQNPLIAKIEGYFGFEDKLDFVYLFGGCYVAMLLLTTVIRSINIYYQTYFVRRFEYRLCSGLVENYLKRDYEWTFRRNSADLGRSVLSEVELVIQGGVMPAVNMITQMLVVTLIVIVLLLLNPLLAISTAVTLSAFYYVVSKIVKPIISKNANIRHQSNLERYRTVQEIFSAIKEIKLKGAEKHYISSFEQPAIKFALSQAVVHIVAQVPKYMVELLAFGGGSVVLIYLIHIGYSIVDMLPIVALYAVAGYRILPALQQIYNGIAQLRFVTPNLNKLKEIKRFKADKLERLRSKKLKGEVEILISDLEFAHATNGCELYSGLNIKIKHGERVAIIGKSGSGKSTLVDLIAGLLKPTEGRIVIRDRDGIVNPEDVSNIGIVTQNTFLKSGSVLENIAFAEATPNLEAVRESANLAQIDQFITDDLKQGYLTQIGNGNMDLSGGQKQRIGIARAIYNKPKILILDEPTSALDVKTSGKLVDSLSSLPRDMIVIFITHRLDDLGMFDRVIDISSSLEK